MHKTVIITGTNGYLGMSIAKRLIMELPEENSLTLVVTSRTFRGVTQAVQDLQSFVWKHLPHRKELIEFDYLLFDQCNMVSVKSATMDILKRYKRIDYIFFNSSYSQMGKINYWLALREFFANPIVAFTVGSFKEQGIASVTEDGMGAAFQANVFSPWYLVNEIKPLLRNGGKLIWISSSISSPEYFDRNDIGIKASWHSYEASKYELELLHHATYKQLLKDEGIESWLLQPGVFKSTTFVPTLNIFSYCAMILMFYICRWCGSPYHCIYPDIAANAPLYLALKATPEKDDMSLKYGSSTTRSGREVLLRTPFNPPSDDCKAVLDYVEDSRATWLAKLKDQVMNRALY